MVNYCISTANLVVNDLWKRSEPVNFYFNNFYFPDIKLLRFMNLDSLIIWDETILIDLKWYKHCMKSIRIRSYSGPQFPYSVRKIPESTTKLYPTTLKHVQSQLKQKTRSVFKMFPAVWTHLLKKSLMENLTFCARLLFSAFISIS